MNKFKLLNYKSLRQTLDAVKLDFITTAKLKPLAEFIGQERALEAIRFGINIKSLGYNLYAMGPAGIGKLTLVEILVKEKASKMPTPPDWCYIHNFEIPEKPIAIQFPAGMGSIFQQDMRTLVDAISSSILTVFESDEYRSGMRRIHEAFKVKRTRRRQRKSSIKKQTIPTIYKERHEKENELQKKLLTLTLEPLIKKLKKKYAKYDNVIHYLTEVQNDVIQHADDYIQREEQTDILSFNTDNPALNKYRVNLLVDNSQLKGAPIILEETPVYANLISRVEHTTQQGLLTTNFTLIRSGSLHRANGGFLLIEMRKLKKSIETWEALKVALYTKQIKIEPIPQLTGTVKAISLQPVSIPLDVKIILLGDRNTYYNLVQTDPDFEELFKVPVDFDEQIHRTPQNIQLYARLIATIAKRHELRTFHASAVAAIIDESTRWAGDIEKLSTYMRDIEGLIIQSDYWASSKNKRTVDDEDVKRAIRAQIHRIDRSKELYHEDIQRDFIIINTTGEAIGQVNCLSVRRVGNFSYGHPTRVTARIRVGKGKLIDIQREIHMSGPMHNKAGLIIANFLASRFSAEHLFALSASIAFEQVYCWTDGDSASVGELCALLSALAEVPIRQYFSVTGSIDQYGEVQAIGGVNEKIEGFFDVCQKRGLNGKQGVLIPDVNRKNLMLREDVIAAAKAKKFFIYTIKTVDEAIELLTGIPTGKRNIEGGYPKNSLYYKIESRLRRFSTTLKKTSKLKSP